MHNDMRVLVGKGARSNSAHSVSGLAPQVHGPSLAKQYLALYTRGLALCPAAGRMPRGCIDAAPRTPVTKIVWPVRSGICSLLQVMALIHSFAVCTTEVMLLAFIQSTYS